MNIKKAEELSGVARQNIRFYECEGLLIPDRNPENNYREYTDKHIQTLKYIRILRMLDMPLDQIRAVLQGEISLDQAAQDQQFRLKKKIDRLSSAIFFCEELGGCASLTELDPDSMLLRMESPQYETGFFQHWREDYRQMALYLHRTVFTFIPEDAVTTAREFSSVLFQYAQENDLDLVITREGMYPEFTINGVEYTAERYYTHVRGIPVATIRCTVKYPEDFEPDLPTWKKRLLKVMNTCWLLIPFTLLIAFIILGVSALVQGEFLSSWQGWLGILGFLALLVTGAYRFWLFHFNDNGK